MNLNANCLHPFPLDPLNLNAVKIETIFLRENSKIIEKKAPKNFHSTFFFLFCKFETSEYSLSDY